MMPSRAFWDHDEEIPLPRLRSISHLWSLAALLSGLGVAALALDMPVARWIAAKGCPATIEKLCSLCETCSHGLGVALVLVLIAVLDPWHRYAIPRIAAASLGSGLMANVVKLGMARWRPGHADLSGRGLETFGDWLPLGANTSWEQSFPSSHTATAAGLAIVLSYFYPRGRWLFPALAILGGMQRITSESHFLSDVLWGAAVGCIFAPLSVYGSRLSRGFDELEQRLLAASSASTAKRGGKPSSDMPQAA